MATSYRLPLTGLLYCICFVQVCVFVSFSVMHFRKQAELERQYGALQKKIAYLRTNCNPLSAESMREEHHDERRNSRHARGTSAHMDAILSNIVSKQEHLLEKHCRNASKLCIAGPRGDTGGRGDTGPQGDIGTPGIKGPKGLQGPVGNKGSPGNPGPVGPAGVKGHKGAPGFRGDKGKPGLRGPQGPPGDVGKQGPPGAKGARGDLGVKGDIGVRGKQGASGKIGNKGDEGRKGQKGQMGPIGQRGPEVVKPNCSCVPAVHVTGKPERNVTVFPGSHLNLNCTTTPYPPTLITWFRDGQAMTSGHDVSVTGDVVHLNITSAADDGTYVCKAGKENIVYNVGVIDLNCNFDGNNICAWQVKPSINQLVWTLHRGQTTSMDTGPDADHTTGRGYYIYIETSTGQTNDFSSLLSPLVYVDMPLCLSFYYNMYGTNIRRLEVGQEDGSGNYVVLWSNSGNQGREWKNISVVIPKTGSGFRIVLRAYRGLGYHGDIAVDDITLESGQCMPKYDLDCDFDTGLCGWIQSKSDHFDWTLHSGTTLSSQTGPHSDHTSGKGKYIYTEASSPRRGGEESNLVSPPLTLTRPICFSFWYHMYGASMGTLRILAKQNSNSALNVVWETSGAKGSSWVQARVTIPAQTRNIVIQGILGHSFLSDMAIDDVSVTSGSC